MPVQLSEKQQRRRKNERANKRDRQRRGAASGKQPAKDPAYLDFIRSRACIVCAMREQRWDRVAARKALLKAQEVDVTDHTGIGNSPRPVQESPTEAAHVGLRGLRQKCSDRETLPLCAEHHRTGPDAHHVLGKKFWEHHGIDREVWIAAYVERYEKEKS